MMEQNERAPKGGTGDSDIAVSASRGGVFAGRFGSASTPALRVEDKPVELTIVDLSATPPPSAPKNPPFMETDPSKESAEKPKEQTFESNANSIAASKLPATGDCAAAVAGREGSSRR